jgi:formate dehydrogenase major subunit
MRFLRRLRAGLPDGDAEEKSIIEIGQPEHSVVTTCAYCGVGCSFKAEMRGEEVVRMVPWKDGKANRGHSCVKGRFAWGYATHKDRILNPMVREKITDPWREVSWDEAFARRQGIPPHPVPVRQGRHRRHHLVALHQ